MNVPRWTLGLPSALALAAVLWACGGGGAPTPDPGGGGPPEDDLPGLEVRPPAPALAFPLAPASPTALDAVRAYPARTLSRPVYVTHAPDGTDRLFVVEQGGRILVFPDDDAVQVSQRRTFLDISARVSRSGNEEGLLGLAFDPDYARTGRFWVHYSAASPRRSVIARFTVTADPDDANEASEQLVLEIPQPYDNHNGGMLAFGPDGMLYVGLGDGGSANDPHGHGQNRTTLLGSLLRIDVRGTAVPYAVPADNPFVGLGGGVRGEIWAYGIRNLWRFSFDRNVGTLWGGDVGQGLREEVSVISRGANLGWNLYEGNLPFQGFPGPAPADYVAPVRDYPRSDGTTVVGGYVVRGVGVPSLRGAYLHGDYGSGRVWATGWDGARATGTTLVATVPDLVSFGEDRDGEVLAVALTGGLFRFRERTPGSAPPFPARLSETGLFADVATLEPAAGLLEYDVNVPLWSDGARKRRWIALPGTSRIGFAETDAWTFPPGTVLVKHFEIDVAPGTVRRLETRVLVNETTGWAGYTYRWNGAGTDADLLAGAASDDLTVEVNGVPEARRWDYPSRTDCLRCHTAAAGRILGVRTRQLNRSFDYALRTANQVTTWNHVGLFTTDVGSGSAHAAFPAPDDVAAPVAVRARAYLDVNCAQCHLPGGPTPVDMDLRDGVPVAAMDVVGVAPTAGTLGLPNAARVRAGAKESSVLWERLRRTDATRMPPLASNVVDPLAVDLIGAWIDGGP
jgi:uncharacterized repeat protein (TIGR03806 family)